VFAFVHGRSGKAAIADNDFGREIQSIESSLTRLSALIKDAHIGSASAFAPAQALVGKIKSQIASLIESACSVHPDLQVKLRNIQLFDLESALLFRDLTTVILGELNQVEIATHVRARPGGSVNVDDEFNAAYRLIRQIDANTRNRRSLDKEDLLSVYRLLEQIKMHLNTLRTQIAQRPLAAGRDLRFLEHNLQILVREQQNLRRIFGEVRDIVAPGFLTRAYRGIESAAAAAAAAGIQALGRADEEGREDEPALELFNILFAMLTFSLAQKLFQ